MFLRYFARDGKRLGFVAMIMLEGVSSLSWIVEERAVSIVMVSVLNVQCALIT